MVKIIKLPLTMQQKQTLLFVKAYIEKNEYPPTINEIQSTLKFNNPGYVHKLLFYLAKKGYVIKLKHERRGIRLTELGEEYKQKEGKWKKI